MLIAARARAKKNNIPFNISEEDLTIPEKCPVLNCKLEHNTGTVKGNSPSIDRIDPCKGYIKNNVRVISHRANTLKRDMTKEECALLLKDFTNV